MIVNWIVNVSGKFTGPKVLEIFKVVFCTDSVSLSMILSL